MRVGINARFLQYPGTGSGQHLIHLLEALARREEECEYILLGPGPRVKLGAAGDIDRLVSRFQAARPSTAGAERLQRLLWEQLRIGRAARNENVDVLHCPYFSAPVRLPCPTVVTIHDVITLMLPEYREHLMNRAYTALVAQTTRRAHAIIAVSECSRRDIVRVLDIPADRVHVIGNAIDATFHPVDDPAERAAMRARLSLPTKFILAGLGFDARKNILGVVEAYSRLSPATRAEYPLVIAGRAHMVGHPLYPDPRPRISALGIQNDVILCGEVQEADKPALYSSATLFVWPSLYEGFGVPVLEAMACGVPVVTSNSSSLPEVTGDAARLVNPTNIEEITSAVHELLSDARLRAELIDRGLKRAATFSWDRVAEQTVTVYRELAA
jgi:glycosyltransferase involved in cell wall biosynthesis